MSGRLAGEQLRALTDWCFTEGKVVGKIRDYSDSLLIFLLKAKQPEVYRDRFDHSGRGENPVHPDPSKMSTPELVAEIEALLAKIKGKAVA